jgi:hypothetical protein
MSPDAVASDGTHVWVANQGTDPAVGEANGRFIGARDCAGSVRSSTHERRTALTSLTGCSAEARSDGRSDIVMVSGGLIPMELFENDPGFLRLLER